MSAWSFAWGHVSGVLLFIAAGWTAYLLLCAVAWWRTERTPRRPSVPPTVEASDPPPSSRPVRTGRGRRGSISQPPTEGKQ